MEKRIKFFWTAGFFLPAINATVFNTSLHSLNETVKFVSVESMLNSFSAWSKRVDCFFERFSNPYVLQKEHTVILPD